MAGGGFIESFLVMLLSLAGIGLPLGMPPGKMDPAIEQAAPDECLVYFNWAGMVAPDPKSENDYERFLAEEEIQQFIKKIDLLVAKSLIRTYDDGNGRVFAEQLPLLAKALLTQPGAIAVGGIDFGPEGPKGDGSLIVSLGEQKAAVETALEKINLALGSKATSVTIDGTEWKQVTLDKGMPSPLWGVHEGYFIAAAGKESLELLLASRKTPEPAWLTTAKKRTGVARRAVLFYLNAEKANELGSSLAGKRWDRIAAALGAGKAKSLTTATGFDGADCIARTQVEFDGEPVGLLATMLGEPLERKDLQAIPADSSFAYAARTSAEELLIELTATLTAIDSDWGEEFTDFFDEVKTKGDLDISKEILEPLGDRWRLFNSPGEGGLVFTGTTLVVSVDDAEQLRSTAVKLQKLVAANIPVGDPNSTRKPRHVLISDFSHAGQTVYYVKSIGETMPFPLAWTITDGELIVSLFPSGVKAYLSRGDDFASLAKTEYADKLFADGAPTAIGYQNPRELFHLFYPIMQYVMHFVSAEAQRDGVDFDVSVLPSAPLISRHLKPAVTTFRRTEYGVEIVGRQSMPSSGMVLSPAFLVVPGMMPWFWYF
ncbi:hypothetical protein [Lignipirellula cremea]|uniref:DUF3352 domain-containing protein n=1 Tax=Lignipirellula cremea TaxID=2528010 RepID=A0A518DX05_9BACT|nr:hypothetical protein [Lignipirellula cremea]QDU96369.1 hypothetical protein Pla8534_41890 [Lignipirellula cremea]